MQRATHPFLESFESDSQDSVTGQTDAGYICIVDVYEQGRNTKREQGL